jgi:hypothetical protein
MKPAGSNIVEPIISFLVFAVTPVVTGLVLRIKMNARVGNGGVTRQAFVARIKLVFFGRQSWIRPFVYGTRDLKFGHFWGVSGPV